ncbi:tRNA 2'-phosphotransferase 1 [Podila epigama]|nr:tRNA 2'-phosphotransferase 1 [Podila epigama]
MSTPSNTAAAPTAASSSSPQQQQQQQKKKNHSNKNKNKQNQNQSRNAAGNLDTNTSTSNASITTNGTNSNNNNNNTNSRNRRGPRGPDSPEVQLSKALSWLLRHNAEAQGVPIRPDGYCLLNDVMAHSKFKKYTIADVMNVVDTNDKKRYEILEEEEEEGGQGEQGSTSTTKKKKEYIRAVQGHSIKAVEDLGSEPLTSPDQIPTAIHGTVFSKWNLIREQGLSKMNRNHIHMAVGLLGEDGVISGMRKSCNLYIHIDTAKALQGGIKFSRTSNNVILSDGLNGDGIIPPKYFLKVVKSSGEQIYPVV